MLSATAPDRGHGRAALVGVVAVIAFVPFLAATACSGSSSSAPSSSASPAGSGAGAATTARAAGATTASAFTLTSPAFADGQPIPKKFTCQGDNVSPELRWSGVPAGTQSMALLMVDPDAPVPGGFTHWVLVNIDPAAGQLPEALPDGVMGQNGAGKNAYAGPCPPSGNHHYVFTLYALREPLTGTVDRANIENLGKSALGAATLTGTYQKS